MNPRKIAFWFGVLHGSAMLLTTIVVSLQMPISQAGYLFAEPWFQATFTDTYLAFLLVYLWTAYLEQGWPRKIAWAIIYICLGNIAMGYYIAWRAWRLPESSTWQDVLVRRIGARK